MAVPNPRAERALASFLFQLHSGLRYLVLLAALVAAIMLLVSLVRKRPVQGGAHGAWRIFVILLDLQVVAGLFVVFTRPFQTQVIGHIAMMALTVVVAHAVSVTFRKRTPERQTPAFLLAGVAGCLVLIVGGIMAIGRPIV
jgi:hypothetical protein